MSNETKTPDKSCENCNGENCIKCEFDGKSDYPGWQPKTPLETYPECVSKCPECFGLAEKITSLEQQVKDLKERLRGLQSCGKCEEDCRKGEQDECDRLNKILKLNEFLAENKERAI